MKLPLFVATILLCAASSSLVADALPMLTESEALRAITLFRTDPVSDLGRGAGGLIMNFVEKSPDVTVKISPKTVPFLSDKSLPEKYRATLVAAFVVGNVDSQLLRHQKRDDSYAGLLQVIDTYRQLQKKNPKLRIPEVENFVEMEKHGKLKSYVTSK